MINDKEKLKLKCWVNKFFNENSLDSKTFDIDSEIDSKLNYFENKEIIRGKLKQLFNVYPSAKLKRKEAEIMPIQQAEIYTVEMKKQNDEQLKLEFEKVIKEIKETKTTDFLDEIYKIPKSFTKMVIKGNINGLLVYGDAGLGKSFNIQKAIIEEGVSPNIISGHITPLKLFECLYNHRQKGNHIIFDDVNLFNNITNLNMFKACLENPREVHYHSSTNKLNIPSSFKFEGSIILLVNRKPENEDMKAVESRILTFELNLDYETKIKLMYEISKIKNYPIEIVDFIKANTSPATKDFNLRKLEMIKSMYNFDKDIWKLLAIDYLTKDIDLELIITLLKKNSSIKSAQKEYTEITGNHRATFYRHKQKLRLAT